MGGGCGFLTYGSVGETSSSPRRVAGDSNPVTPNQRLSVAPQQGACSSSSYEPPRAARRRELSQAAATAASVALPPPHLL